jgi:hypothetical protein
MALYFTSATFLSAQECIVFPRDDSFDKQPIVFPRRYFLFTLHSFQMLMLHNKGFSFRFVRQMQNIGSSLILYSKTVHLF